MMPAAIENVPKVVNSDRNDAPCSSAVSRPSCLVGSHLEAGSGDHRLHELTHRVGVDRAGHLVPAHSRSARD